MATIDVQLLQIVNISTVMANLNAESFGSWSVLADRFQRAL
jgi:hypothetical protein